MSCMSPYDDFQARSIELYPRLIKDQKFGHFGQPPIWAQNPQHPQHKRSRRNKANIQHFQHKRGGQKNETNP